MSSKLIRLQDGVFVEVELGLSFDIEGNLVYYQSYSLRKLNDKVCFKAYEKSNK